MSDSNEFLQLLDGCRQRNSSASAEFVRRYLPHVRTAVRRRLSGQLRTRFDSQDFAQDVWLSFFRKASRCPDIQDEQTLIAYLCQMARLKILEEYRHATTLKDDMRRVGTLGTGSEPIGREPTPSQAAITDEQWRKLIAKLTDRDRAMLSMLRDGHTHLEIATAFGLSEKTIQRLVRKVFEH